MICDCAATPAIEPGLGADTKLSCSTEGSMGSGVSTWSVVASPDCWLRPSSASTFNLFFFFFLTFFLFFFYREPGWAEDRSGPLSRGQTRCARP